MTRLISRLPFALILAGIGLVSHGAGGSDRARAAGPAMATFDVSVIHARRAQAPPDPALAPLLTYLSKSFSRYRSFRRLDHRSLEVPEGDSGTMTLPGRKKLALRFVEAKRGFVKVHLSLDGLKTTIQVKDGGLFFQAGRVHEDGILVLAISARSRPGDR